MISSVDTSSANIETKSSHNTAVTGNVDIAQVQDNDANIHLIKGMIQNGTRQTKILRQTKYQNLPLKLNITGQGWIPWCLNMTFCTENRKVKMLIHTNYF